MLERARSFICAPVSSKLVSFEIIRRESVPLVLFLAMVVLHVIHVRVLVWIFYDELSLQF